MSGERLPITEVVDLARKYTADEWDGAANRAASPHAETVCRAMANLRRWDG